MGILGAIGTGTTIAITIKAIDSFSSVFNKAEGGMGLLTKTAGIAVGAFAGLAVGIGAAGVASVKLATDFEQTTVAFTTMLGSAEEAEKFLKELANFAKTTPFTLPGVEKSARQLLAVGFEAENVLPTLENVGNVAAGLGLGEAGLERLILNLGQVQSQGKLTGRELRDFAVAGIPLLDELSKQLGISTEAVSEMVSKGEINTQIVLDAFKSMGSEGGRFADLMEKQSKTVAGRFSNLQDTVTLLGRELGMMLLPIVSDLADVFLNDVLPAISPLVPLIGDALMKVLGALIPILPKIVDVFIQFVEVGLELFDAMEPLIEPLVDLALTILPILLDGFKALIPVIRPLVKILVPFLELLVPIVELIGSLISGIGKISGSILGSILGVGASAVGSVKNSFVNDAIIKPNGQIIHTNPNDTIFATQNPGGMGGGTTIVIEGNIYGTDPDEMADAFADAINKKIRI